MSILPRLAGAKGRKDEEPNKELGRELVQNGDLEGIQEVADNLCNDDRRVRIDCLSVLEQVGLLAPALTEDYVPDFLRLVFSKDNRLVWAAMINLALVADRRPQQIFDHYDELVQVIDKGSVITRDNGLKVLARVAEGEGKRNHAITPYLLDQLRTCRPKSVPQYAESVRVAVTPYNQAEYIAILEERLASLSTAQQKRVAKVLRSFDGT
jgi:hypothetical protein